MARRKRPLTVVAGIAALLGLIGVVARRVTGPGRFGESGWDIGGRPAGDREPRDPLPLTGAGSTALPLPED